MSDDFFLSQKGGGLGNEAVEQLVSNYTRQAGLEETAPLTLQHSFGKRLLDSVVDLLTVSALLWHERLGTTAIYTQPGPRDLGRAVQ